jgi:hypothetical protein
MWTGSEIAFLRSHASLGAEEIARELGRSTSSVKSAAKRLRISLRRPGSRRGLVLGQPRSISLRRELRAGALSGRVSAEALEARRRLEELEICPSCAAREITNPKTGLCTVCHKRGLERAHREELERLRAEDAAQRDLWQARQEVKRARDRRAP